MGKGGWSADSVCPQAALSRPQGPSSGCQWGRHTPFSTVLMPLVDLCLLFRSTVPLGSPHWPLSPSLSRPQPRPACPLCAGGSASPRVPQQPLCPKAGNRSFENRSSGCPHYNPLRSPAGPPSWGPCLSRPSIPSTFVPCTVPLAAAWSAPHTAVTTGFLEINHFFLCPGIRWRLPEGCGKARLHLAFQATDGPICDTALLLTGTHNFSEKRGVLGSCFTFPKLLMLASEPPVTFHSSKALRICSRSSGGLPPVPFTGPALPSPSCG